MVNAFDPWGARPRPVLYAGVGSRERGAGRRRGVQERSHDGGTWPLLGRGCCLPRRPGAGSQTAPPSPIPQNPSPMVEHTRNARAHRARGELKRHERRTFDGPIGKPVELFIPAGTRGTNGLHLVVHFLGAGIRAGGSPYRNLARTMWSRVVQQLVQAPGCMIAHSACPLAYDSLLASITARGERGASCVQCPSRTSRSSGFSAGHGAIRAILRDSHAFSRRPWDKRVAPGRASHELCGPKAR